MACAIGIDYGSKRVGVAITDTLGIIASPLGTWHSAELVEMLKKLVPEKKVSVIVVGQPQQLSGAPTDASKMTDEFCVHISRVFPQVRIDRVDERFTSSMAAKSLVENGIPKKKRQDKSLLDAVSAAIILQSWLDSPASKL
jgi:putative Holliday junction resolvase